MAAPVPPSPRREGVEPVFRHLDDPDVPWQAVKAQRNADGSTAHVWEKWLAFSPDPQYLTLYARYDPGMIVRRHGHFSPHIVFVLEGEATFGGRPCPAGTHIELPLGAAFGPVVAGPEGAVMFEVMMGDPRSWGDEPEAFDGALAAHGAERLPDPPLEYPEWLSDLRSHWDVATPEPGALDRVQLRAATVQDRGFLERMLLVAVHWRPGTVAPPVEEVLAQPALGHYVDGWPRAGELGVIAEAAGGDPIGAAWCRTFSAEDPGYGFVGEAVPEISIGVVEEARGRGVGRALMAALIEAATQRGIGRLSLSVETENPAMRLYETLGFVPVSEADGSATMVRELS